MSGAGGICLQVLFICLMQSKNIVAVPGTHSLCDSLGSFKEAAFYILFNNIQPFLQLPWMGPVSMQPLTRGQIHMHLQRSSDIKHLDVTKCLTTLRKIEKCLRFEMSLLFTLKFSQYKSWHTQKTRLDQKIGDHKAFSHKYGLSEKLCL